MSELPTSFLVVGAFVVLATGLVVFFVSKQLLFRRYKRKAEEALQQRRYLAAMEFFGRAEALWALNATKQTMPSYQRDLTTLEELINGLDAAAHGGGVALTLDEYRSAVQALQLEFDGDGTKSSRTRAVSYASAFMRLKNAQSGLRQQLCAIERGEND